MEWRGDGKDTAAEPMNSEILKGRSLDAAIFFKKKKKSTTKRRQPLDIFFIV